MKRMSKKFYVGALVSAFSLLLMSLIIFVGLVIFTPASDRLHQTLGRENWQNVNILIMAFAVGSAALFLIVHVVVTLALLYKMWAAIEDGHARATPAKAVGFLFIPFFNLYWIFQVWSGFPKDYNEYAKRYQLQTPSLSAGIYKAYPILILLSAIPFAGILSAVVGFFVFMLIAAKTCDAINNLATAIAERGIALRQISLQH